MIVKCKNCGKEFLTYPSKIKLKKGRYCSRKCYLESRESVIRKCLYCGNKFKVKKSWFIKGKGKFCSRSCMGKYQSKFRTGNESSHWQGGASTLICKNCGKEFKPRGPYELTQEYPRKYCSRRCAELDMTKEKHPCWKGGISKEPYPFDFDKELKEIIKKRDGYQCQLCDISQNGIELSIHHIDYNKKNLNKANLITLCKACNAKVNFNRNYWKNYFTDSIENLKGVEANA